MYIYIYIYLTYIYHMIYINDIIILFRFFQSFSYSNWAWRNEGGKLTTTFLQNVSKKCVSNDDYSLYICICMYMYLVLIIIIITTIIAKEKIIFPELRSVTAIFSVNYLYICKPPAFTFFYSSCYCCCRCFVELYLTVYYFCWKSFGLKTWLKEN